jgi:hypothetical protein
VPVCVCAARGVGVYGDGAEQGMSGGPMLLPECQRDRLTARGEVFSLEGLVGMICVAIRAGGGRVCCACGGFCVKLAVRERTLYAP